MIGKPLLNSLEPASLYDCFIAHTPDGFAAHWLELDGTRMPAFLTPFDLLTTLDEDIKRYVEKQPLLKSIARALLRPLTIFAGTTVSEYAVYTVRDSCTPLLTALLGDMKSLGAKLAILKDVPQNSPLLSARENEAADRLLAECRAHGFTILAGQALAYVPIDFNSEDEYLERLSKARRKNLRRKLRNRPQLQIETFATGAPEFGDEKWLGVLYAMYENVFNQSQIQFDKLSRAFFDAVFRDNTTNGILFLYSVEGKLIGWNLCFVCNGNLVDKYIGLVYPDARDISLYFISWFHNLAYARRMGLSHYIAGWTDPKVKAALGAKFTFTHHAAYLRNPLLRFGLSRCQRFFEPDMKIVESEIAT